LVTHIILYSSHHSLPVMCIIQYYNHHS